jgi:putative Mn2+ efflux pump MntP
MSLLEIIIIAIGLAMDAFAVSLAAGATGYASGPRAVFRLSFHFGLFQFLMPVIGWTLGMTVSLYISAFDHWIAFGLLVFVGIRMIRSGLNPDADHLKRDPSRGLTLIMLSIATSIDALAVGLSLAVLKVSIWYPCVIIGVVTSVISLAGIGLGNKLSSVFGKRMEIIGGIILIIIALRILIVHLFN